jgi:hypothetical protein
VTDDAGCSTAQIFTGQTMSCNGSSLARVSHQVTVGPSNCKRLRKKLKRQKHGLAKASAKRKRSMIRRNIADTKRRLRKVGC